MLCNIIKTESGAGMENKENTINKVDKVTETLIKELEGLNEEGLHEFFMFVYKMNHQLGNMIAVDIAERRNSHLLLPCDYFTILTLPSPMGWASLVTVLLPTTIAMA